ncbi:hypothetical protein CAPTEDRAFT_202386 [Capitella teleta]|uniref:Uncharacterized protein n=1 Tax=Capitella teleta TaxID=283909 RepID=R7TJJ2_CAPTE|nr:hypothetical protein CAPTEDRAFT_202386 [Capitella teleta]|eukprot:ELT91270.1 hypothetical protein CAPTEDRAFT_202386 [Capitella teleta]
MTQTPTIPALQLPQRPVMASVGTQTEWERDVQPSVSEQLNVSLRCDSSYADNDQIDPDYLPEDAPPHEAEWHIAEVGSAIVVKAEGEQCVIGGDGRADTPGHCAKYESYTVMDLKRRQILDTQLVQSNEVGGSYHMELEGMKRCLARLQESSVEIEAVVTDRHKQIAKWLREEKGNVTHYTDIWHCAKGSAAAVKLEELVFNKYLLKDLATLSPHYQTYDLEAFHSLLNQFAPKMTAFHFQAMNGRVLLAVMHFNENSNRQSKISRDGKEQYSIHYPKYRKGDPIVRKIKTAPTHNYVGELVKRVDILVASNTHQPLADKPPTLASQYVTPEKGELVLRHRGRFI